MKSIITLIVLFAFVSCSSTTTVSVSDPAATIYIDGEMKGKGVVTHTDTKIVGSSTSVMVKKKGCATRYYNFSRNEEFDAGACAGGVFLAVPFLWVMKYKPSHTYEYSCEKE